MAPFCEDGPTTDVAHLNRLVTIGELAASVLHQINGHLTYVLFSIERLERLGMSAEAGEAVSAIREGAECIRQLSRDVTLLARGAPDRQSHALDLAEVVRTSLRIARPRVQAAATLVEDLRAAPLVRGNVMQFLQVLINVLLNAADACEESADDDPTIRVSLGTGPDGEAAISIMDNGRGRPSNEAERVFEPFFTTKPPGKGTGLGLSLAKRIVEEAGGQITFNSVEGLGTIVRIAIPATAT